MAAYNRAIVAIPICREHRLCEFQVRVLQGIVFIVYPTTVALSNWTLAPVGVILRHLLCWRLLGHKLHPSILRKVRSLLQSELPTHCDLVLLLSVSLSSSSSYLRLLPHLPITSIFTAIKCFRRQFPSKIWPIQTAYLLFTAFRIFHSSLTLCHTSFLTRSVQMTFPITSSKHPQIRGSKRYGISWQHGGIDYHRLIILIKMCNIN